MGIQMENFVSMFSQNPKQTQESNNNEELPL